MSGKTATTTSTMQVPQEVLARYTAANNTAQTAASAPFQQYSTDPSAFVAPLSATQQSGIANTNAASGQAQPYYGAATGLTLSGAQNANPTALDSGAINQYMSPYLNTVLGSTEALVNQQNQQQQAGQLGNAITSGAFGGDRSGIAAANLAQQQQLAGANTYANISNSAYNNALGAAQQQQGVGLAAQQANLQRQLGAGAQLGGLGAGAQSAALQGAAAQLSAGQQEQSTQQAGQTALYNQFLQQQAYPFQTAQFLANIAEGTGSLSGSTTQTTQPTGLFGNLLSDRRVKEDIRKMGKAKNGLNIYSFKYKGDPEKVTHIGFMADEVEKKHPEAVGSLGGLKTVDYERASRADGGGLVFDPNMGEYGLGGSGLPGRGTYVPAPSQSAARHMVFPNTPPLPHQMGLGDVASSYKEMKGLYNDGSQLWNDGKSVVSGLGGGNYSHGGLALARDYGGPIDDPYQSDADLQRRERGLAATERLQEQAPNSSANGPVSSALSSQSVQPRYSLQTPSNPSGSSANSGLGQLAAVAGLTKDVMPYVMDALALNSGGLVPREHHADGDIVGDNDPNSPENRAIREAYPSANYDQPAASVAGLAPDNRAVPVKPTTGLHPVNEETPAPMPPRRPVGLGVSPDDVASQPDLTVPAQSPSPHYSPAPATGLAAAGQDASSFLINRESGGKFNATNPASSAYGLGQFTSDTAKTVAARHPELPSLADFYNSDPAIAVPAQKAYVAAHAQDQAKILASDGIDPTPQNIHVNWFLGEAGGPAFLKAMAENPNAPAASLARPEQVAANKSLFYRPDGTPRTAAETYAILNNGDGSGGGGGARSNPAPQQPGLMGSLSSLFHGQPDGQTSPNGGMGERALMGVLSGLGAIGSYRGMSPLGAALQGLGAGAQGWMQSGKQQADIANTQAHTGLAGAETNSVNVGAARNSVLPEANMYIDPNGNVRYINKNIAGTEGIPLYGGVPNASTKQVPYASPVAGSPTTPSAPASTVPPPAKTSANDPSLAAIGWNDASAEKAKNEVLVGPQSRGDIEQSQAYQAATQAAGETSQQDLKYSRLLASTLVHGYDATGGSAPGYKFADRAGAVSALNTAARAVGLGESYFGDADKGLALSQKIEKLQGAMMERNFGHNSVESLNSFKGVNANLDQPPEASAEIAAQLMSDKMAAQDKWRHMEQWKANSPGSTVRGAAADFALNNPPEKFNKEADELKSLMLTPKISPFLDKLTSGKYSYQAIGRALKENGYDPNLARYFAVAK